MNRLWLAMVLSAIWVASAFAADHLVPDSSQLAGYQATVKAVLKDAFQPDVRARVIAEPSFEAEFAVGIKEVAGSYTLFFIKPAAQVWDYTVLQMLKAGEMSAVDTDGRSRRDAEITRLESLLPSDPSKLMTERCAAPIDAGLAKGVLDVWNRMLLQTRPDETKTVGLDGETFYFSMELGQRALSGSTWSPDQESKPGKLVGIVYAMRRYCAKQQSTELTALSSLTHELRARLNEP